MKTGRIRAALVAVALAAIAAIAVAGVALAAKPIKGAHYSGTVHRVSNITFAISFKVSASGKKVTNLVLSDALFYCQGGGFPHLGTAKAAKISKKGTFTATIPLLAILTNKPSGSEIVTGKFGSHGKESGKVRTKLSGGTTCDGTSTYTTTG